VVQRQTADRQALLLYACTFGAVTCIGRQTCISTFEQWSSLVARNLLEYRPASELETVSNTARYNEPAPVACYTCVRKILIAPGQKSFAFLSQLILSTASDTEVAARRRRADIRTGKLRQTIDLVAGDLSTGMSRRGLRCAEHRDRNGSTAQLLLQDQHKYLLLMPQAMLQDP